MNFFTSGSAPDLVAIHGTLNRGVSKATFRKRYFRCYRCTTPCYGKKLDQSNISIMLTDN